MTLAKSSDSLSPKEIFYPPLTPLPEKSNRQTLCLACNKPCKYCNP